MERTKQQINLILKHTSADYKGSDGKSILYGHPTKGTVLGPVATMPDCAFKRALDSAINSERREQNTTKIKSLLTGFGAEHLLPSLNPCLMSSRQFFLSFVLRRIQSAERVAFIQQANQMQLVF